MKIDMQSLEVLAVGSLFVLLLLWRAAPKGSATRYPAARIRRAEPPEGGAAVTLMNNEALWLLTWQILEQDGPLARAFVAERISASLTLGDRAGIENWQAVALKLNELLQQEGRLN